MCSVLFLAPLLRALQGDPQGGADASEAALLGTAMAKNGPRQDYARATLARAEDGTWIATPLPDQDSSLVKALALADALIVRPIGAPAAASGEPCRILRLAAFGA